MKEKIVEKARIAGFKENEIYFIEEWSEACIGGEVINGKFYILYSYDILVQNAEDIDEKTEEIENFYSYYPNKIKIIYD